MLRKVSARRDRTQKVLYSKHFVTSQKCPYHVTFDLETLTLSTPWMQAHLGTILFLCKFGGDRVMFVVEVAICAKFTDGQTDGQTDRRTTDASRLHKLME